MNYIENELVIRKYWQLHYSYDNFIFDDIPCDKVYDSLKECYEDYKEEVKVNKDLMKAIDEPKCYYRLVLNEETESTNWVSVYRVVHHRNGKVSLKRVD